MTRAERLSRLRQEIRQACEGRQRLEREILTLGVVLQGSLIQRHLGTAERRRKAPAYYLSRAEGGRTRLLYIPREQVPSVRKTTPEWRRFKSFIRGWEEMSDRIGRLLRQVGPLREEGGDGTTSHSSGPS